MNVIVERFFQYLIQSKQSKSIQKLKLNNTPIESSLQRMAALTTLELEQNEIILGQETNLTQCLNECPAMLKNLMVDYSFFENLSFRNQPGLY
jgi:hypothetical protein